MQCAIYFYFENPNTNNQNQNEHITLPKIYLDLELITLP